MIDERLRCVRRDIARSAAVFGVGADDIRLIAVTKTHGCEVINEAIRCGVTDIGENKVQEILDKYDKVLPVRWHLIGHLQSNKVKYIIDKVCLIHSVDSIHLMDEIERQAVIHNVSHADILIQVNISGEETKFGVPPEEVGTLFAHCEHLSRVRVKGLMTVLPRDCDDVTKKLLFNNIREIFVDKRVKTYHNVSMEYLSMGMSGDFTVAVECGANMVRIGSRIFGERNYFHENGGEKNGIC